MKEEEEGGLINYYYIKKIVIVTMLKELCGRFNAEDRRLAMTYIPIIVYSLFCREPATEENVLRQNRHGSI